MVQCVSILVVGLTEIGLVFLEGITSRERQMLAAYVSGIQMHLLAGILQRMSLIWDVETWITLIYFPILTVISHLNRVRSTNSALETICDSMMPWKFLQIVSSGNILTVLIIFILGSFPKFVLLST